MKLNTKQNILLLKKGVLMILFFLITFFWCVSNTFAANFKYGDFDFDKFAEDNLGYWTNSCAEESSDSQSGEESKEEKKCKEKTLANQEKFYTRLYKLLDKFSKKYGMIDDKIIITTVFFELDPAMFSDDGEKYKELTNSDGSAYEVEDDDISVYDPDSDDDDGSKDSGNYFASESDTLKNLIKAMIAYETHCYGTFERKQVKNDDGTTSYYCDGGTEMEIDGSTKCAEEVSKGAIGWWNKKTSSGIANFFGIKSSEEKDCDDAITSANKYKKSLFTVADKKTVNTEFYWDFLKNSNYFDRKAHLQYRYATILNKTNHENMSELTDKEYEDNMDEIIENRSIIIDCIKSILESYGTGGEDNSNNMNSASSNMYWWPVGSAETSENNGVTMASGDPVSVNVSSYYGMRMHPIQKVMKMHGGVDLTGSTEAGKVPVIASKDGVVTTVVNNCTSYGDQSCGGGYGNYIIISHVDGNYTLYAHLHENSITVKENDTVKQGQVIGKMGSSGGSTGTHLHFEVRTGATSADRVDPMEYIDPENPRPAGSSSNIATMIQSMEGTGPMDGDYYVVYQNKGDIPTVGHGLTLQYNVQLFADVGIDSTTLKVGDKVPKDKCDQAYANRLKNDSNDIASLMSSKGYNFNQAQLDALASLRFNCGNIVGFEDAYNAYGSTDALCTNWWHGHYTNGGLAGLVNRRKYECRLFVHGEYYGVDY